ncbi:FadR/GntR family transcriptional regulator [Pseudonocardia spinosispora]|uniref:FadR/GntR family transcriptional regulator n=1 Tax=Pseudonocardia spinosispora TaxID=103441 RepID=UPI00048B6EB9|nr:GntR family transcriptional regulator [Pseudonocardia spinosispora]
MTRSTKDQAPRAYQRIVDHVEAAVAAGELSPGDRLPSERELVAKFGVARSSVREALRVLESKELVRSRPGDPRGPLVLPFSLEPMRRSMAMLTSTRTLTLPELIQFRMVVDASTNLMAAARRTGAQLIAMERNIARMRESMTIGYEVFGRADLEFHELIAEAAGNKFIQVCGDVAREAILELITRRIVDAEDHTALMLRSLRHHGAVFTAIADRDGHRASRLAREGLYDHYADHVDDEARTVLEALVLEVGGRLPR